ncbi:MAG: hypothetical protein C6Y22_01315 [Hapalosiphonaceae cyanobacterium JJU2]|nr:MAG: hypothetical protein C6Y22_01315 [Hapalosiphonaceae cyanobacterium JJU2]
MNDDSTSIPVTSLFFREVQNDLQENFHPCMEKLHSEITTQAEAIRLEVESKKWIKKFDGDLLDEPVLGVDASTVSRDYGEVSTALAVGVVSSTSEEVKPKYFYQAVYGTSSETFSKVASYLRVTQELAALRYACDSDHWVMYDGSFNALNMDLCKFAASMPNDLSDSVDDPDFLEWELVKDSYRRCLLSVDSDWFTIFGQPNSKGVNRLISLSKKGISKYYSRQLKALSSITDNAFLPSDKLILGMILQSDEYTSPVSYEQVFQGSSHGSKVPGYGKPNTGKNNNLEQQHQLVETTFKNMRIVNFRPWPWSPVMTIHYNKISCKLEDVLGVVKSQTQTRSIMEPMPLYLADLLSKQASSVIKLYGEINVGRYPNLFRAFRTSTRN